MLRPLQKLRQMQWTFARGLLYLCLATEPIRKDDVFLRHSSKMRTEPMVVHLHRDVVLVFLESEAPGHPAAAIVENLCLRTHIVEKLFLRIEADDRLLMEIGRASCRERV